MSEVSLRVQVHCLQPNWVEHEHSQYRLYVNDDLITERTWIWPMNTYIAEELLVDVTERESHIVRLETILDNPRSLTQFGLQNFYVNGWPKPHYGGDRTQLSFMLG
jgi:hypothetical protein